MSRARLPSRLDRSDASQWRGTLHASQWRGTTRLSLLEADWPEADRALLAGLRARGELFDRAGALSHLKPISVRNLVTACGRWLGWLARVAPEALKEPPVERATPERFRAWIGSLGHLAPASRHALGDPVLWMLKLTAPEADWRAHGRVLSLVRHAMTEHRSTRKDGRILSTAVLLEAAQARSLELGQGSPIDDLKVARARRDAAMVAFLAVLPIRRRSFCGLEIGTSYLVAGTGPTTATTTAMQVVLDRAMTKTGQPWEAPVPPALADIMADYLEHVRPVLLARGAGQTTHLWLNDSGRPYFPIHWAARIRTITEDYVGVRVTPHMFRDCAATTLATSSLEHARLIRALLGHTNFRTGEEHYNQAQGIEAGRRYAEIIARLGAQSP